MEAEKRAGLQKSAEEEENTAISSQISGSNRATIGETTISTAEAAMIRDEVQKAVRHAFPGIKHSTGQASAEVIDLAGSTALSAPLAIAGSEVSVASTQPHNGTEGNKTSFSKLVSGRETVNSAQTFATAQWRPKEPPCYYGRSTEDVHKCVITSPSWEVMMHSRSHML